MKPEQLADLRTVSLDAERRARQARHIQPTTLHHELAQRVDLIRSRGGTMIDLHEIDRLLDRHHAAEVVRPDLLSGDQLSRVMAP